MVQTLIFAKGQTREGMKWTIIDTKTNKPVDLTGATVNIIAFDAADRTTIIIQNTAELLIPETNGQCQYFFGSGESDRAGTYEIELNPIDFASGDVGILDEMQIILKAVGPGS